MLTAAWRRWQQRRALSRYAIADADWRAAVSTELALRRLDPRQQARLRRGATLILAGKDFYGLDGFELGPTAATRIAALAALLILELGDHWYDDWHSILVSPDSFHARHDYPDETGVVHEVEEWRAGEAWAEGPVRLSWGDIEAGTGVAGYNVVLHEFAHRLDMRDGVANGRPPLHPDQSAGAWAEAFSRCYEDLQALVAAGDPTAVDPYAAEGPEECFAVLTESFFETPAVVRDAYPAVYDQLAAFYRQDPVSGGDA